MTAALAPAAPASDFERLFLAQYARVVAIARRIVADAAEAEDVAQDVFAQFVAGRDAAHPGAAAWLYAAAAHQALNAVRSRRRRGAREVGSARLAGALEPLHQHQADPALAVVRAELRAEVATAMRRLRRRDAALLALRYGGDLSYREIAAALRVPESHVGTLLARAERAFYREMHRA